MCTVQVSFCSTHSLACKKNTLVLSGCEALIFLEQNKELNAYIDTQFKSFKDRFT